MRNELITKWRQLNQKEAFDADSLHLPAGKSIAGANKVVTSVTRPAANDAYRYSQPFLPQITII